MNTFAKSLFVCSGLVSFSLVTVAAAGAADNLSGAWKGGGKVTYSSGSTESARCRAIVSPSGKMAYDVSATCATQSGTVSQQAFVRGHGNTFRGTFYNPEFDTTGTMVISVNGRSSTVRLTSQKASAVLRLSR